jgi:hypothetical protein
LVHVLHQSKKGAHLTTVQTPTNGVLYTIDLNNIEAIGISAYRGTVIILGNRYVYDSVGETVEKYAHIKAVEASSGVEIWLKEYNGWEAASLQSGLSGIEGCSMVLNWFEGSTLGNVGTINQPTAGDQFLINVSWLNGNILTLFIIDWKEGNNAATGTKLKVKQLHRYREPTNTH